MITVGMNYDVLEGKEAIFENAFNKVIHAMRNAAGHSVTHLYRNVHAPRSYLIISDWSDTSAFEGFIASAAFKAVTNWGAEQILAGRPRHQVYGQ